MRIFHLSDVRPDSIGGAQSFLRDLASGLRRRGHQVRIWAGVDHYRDDLRQADSSWRQEIEEFRPDVLHVHNWALLTDQRGRAIFATGVPTVASLADYMLICRHRMRLHNWLRCPTPCAFECGPRPWAQEMRAILGGTRLVTFCPGAAGVFAAHNLRVETIPIGLDLSLWQWSPSGEAVGACCAYKHYWWKGLDDSEAAARSACVPLAVARDLSQPELSSWYRGLRVFLAAGVFDETFGLTMAEAMASGAIIVAYANTGARQLLDGGAGRLVPLGNRWALAETLREVLAIPAGQRRSMAARARERIETEFSQELMVRRWEQLYGELAHV